MTPDIEQYILQQIREHLHDGNYSQRINLFDLFGFVETVTTEPSGVPLDFYGQFKIYNGILYYYDFDNGVWNKSSSLAYSNTTVPAGNTVNNSTAETAFASSFTFPANTLKVGNSIHLKLWGVYGTTAVAPTIRGKIKLGSTIMLDTTAITCVINLTNQGWSAEADFIVTAIGASGTIEAQGYAEFATALTTSLSVNVPNTAAITIDTTASQALTVTVQWGTADTANTITLREMLVTVNK